MVHPTFVLSPSAIVGGFPPKASLVAAMMKGRMMVVDSQSISPLKSSFKFQVKSLEVVIDDVTPFQSKDNTSQSNILVPQSNDSEGDEWGYTACDEMARLYQAEPVIQLMHDDDAEGDDSVVIAVAAAADCGGGGGGSAGVVVGGDHLNDDNNVKDEVSLREQGLNDEISPGPGQGLGQGQDMISSFHTLTWRNFPHTKLLSQTSAHASQTSSAPSQNVVLSKKRRRQLQSASYVKVLPPPLSSDYMYPYFVLCE